MSQPPIDSASSMNGQIRNGIPLTMVSVFHDAKVNPLRKTAAKKAVRNWVRQKHLPDEILFIELGYNGVFTFEQNDFPRQVKYVRIQGDDSHKYLFQKECLWNAAAKMARNEKLMFVDSDIAPKGDVDWFKKACAVLDKAVFAQGFRQITYLDQDDKPTLEKKMSYSTKVSGGYLSSTGKIVPGGVYCIRKSTLDKIGGFNFLPFGGGDDLFWCELIGKGTNNLCIKLTRRSEVGKTVKRLAKAGKMNLVSYVNADVCHFYHGPMKGRSRTQRHYLALSQYPWMGTIIEKDENGLLRWTDCNHYFYSVMSKFHTLNDSQDSAAELLSGKLHYNVFVGYVNQIKLFNLACSRKRLDELVRYCIRQSKFDPKNPNRFLSNHSSFYYG